MAKPNIDFVDDVPEVNTDFVDDVAPAAESPTGFISKAKAEGRAEELANGLVRVKAPDKSVSQVFEGKTGQYVATPEDIQNAFRSTESASKADLWKKILGMAQAVSPFTDEAQAAVSMVGKGLQGKSTSYANELAGARKTLDDANDATPLPLKLAAGIGSGVVSAPAAAGTFLGRSGVNALTGAIQGYGDSDKQAILDKLLDAGKGAALSAALGTGVEGIGAGLKKGAQALSPTLRGLGEKATLKALGLYAGINNKLSKAGMDPVDVAPFVDEIQSTGVIKPFSTTTQTRGVLEQKLNEQKQLLDDAIGKANASGKFSGQQASEDILQRVSKLNEIEKDYAAKAQQMAEALKRSGDMSFSDAVNLKRTAQGLTNYALDVPVSQEIQQKAASTLRQSIENQMRQKAGDVVASQYTAANKKFVPLMQAQEFLDEDVARQLGRNSFSLTDLMVGSTVGGPGGFMLGGMPGMSAGTLAATALSSAVRSRGPSTLAAPLLGAAEKMKSASQFSAPQLTQNPLLNEYFQRLARPKEEKTKEGRDAMLSAF